MQKQKSKKQKKKEVDQGFSLFVALMCNLIFFLLCFKNESLSERVENKKGQWGRAPPTLVLFFSNCCIVESHATDVPFCTYVLPSSSEDTLPEGNPKASSQVKPECINRH